MSDTLLGETRGLLTRPFKLYVRSVLLLHFSATFHRIQFKLPRVFAAIENLHTVNLDVDEYDIKGRLAYLTGRWGETCPFLGQSQHQGQVALVRIHSICDISMSLK